MTYEAMLLRLAGENPDLIVMTAENRAVIRGLPDKLGPRFIDVGIAEQTLIGAAAGLALRGRRPVVHALAAFLTMRAFEFIRTDVGIAGLPVILVGGFAGFLSEANGPTHQAIDDIGLMRGIPGMGVFAPASLEELLDGFPRLLDAGGPWYVRYHGAPAGRDVAPVRIGRAERLGEGRDIVLLTYGVLLPRVEEAAARLRGDGLSVGVRNMRFLEPVDRDAIVEAAESGALLVTVEDHFRRGGLRAAVDEVLSERRIAARVASLDLGRSWFRPALLPAVLEVERFTGAAIADRVREEIAQHA